MPFLPGRVSKTAERDGGRWWWHVSLAPRLRRRTEGHVVKPRSSSRQKAGGCFVSSALQRAGGCFVSPARQKVGGFFVSPARQKVGGFFVSSARQKAGGCFASSAIRRLPVMLRSAVRPPARESERWKLADETQQGPPAPQDGPIATFYYGGANHACSLHAQQPRHPTPSQASHPQPGCPAPGSLQYLPGIGTYCSPQRRPLSNRHLSALDACRPLGLLKSPDSATNTSTNPRSRHLTDWDVATQPILPQVHAAEPKRRRLPRCMGLSCIVLDRVSVLGHASVLLRGLSEKVVPPPSVLY
ncbi:hypothetical protein CDD83_245 [Cordyceps sp. RAO-2017]|nr:hypothetical protein CDD83_245 [Cordyceps sp. RAO-2017]